MEASTLLASTVNIASGHNKKGEVVEGKYPIYPYPAACGLWTCRSANISDAVILESIKKKDFTIFTEAREPNMDFFERATLAEELQVDWENVFKHGYTINFLHTNALKRLLLLRHNFIEGKDYVQDDYELVGVPLTETQAADLLLLMHRQWEVVLEDSKLYRLRRKKFSD